MLEIVKITVHENEVLISGIDLDSLWVFTDHPAEDAECTEVTYKFDITLAGPRKYLYLVTKNNKKANEFTYMDQRLEALVGQIIQLSDNFRVKDEA